MTYKLPFKKSEVKLTFITIVDETGNNSIELPDRPYTYKDQEWIVANTEALEKNDMGLVAEYVLRSHLDVPEGVSRNDLLTYEDGSPFSMYFTTAIAAHLLNKVKATQDKLEELGEAQSKSEPRSNNKGSRKSV